MEFFEVDKLDNAINKLYNVSINSFKLQQIKVNICVALGFVSVNDIISKEDVPSFRRSTVDGYAVKSKNLSNVSESSPTFIKIVGESFMGEKLNIDISDNECIYVPTGGMVPNSSDSVVMIEYVEKFTDDKIAVYKSVSSLENIINIGDDNNAGDVLVKKGRKITESDIGLLASNGIYEILVYKKFDISIISTGDEIVDINDKKDLCEIRDINTYTLIAKCKKNGYNIINHKLFKDDKNLIKNELMNYMKNSDVVILSGGSSKGKKDVTKDLIDEVCSSKCITRGIAVKPGKPTITGYDEMTKTFVIGLPGHPMATFILFDLIINSLYEKLTSMIDNNIFYKFGKMKENIVQSPGKKTFQLVNIDENNNVSLIFGKSGFISILSKADGYIIIDENSEGINKGDTVKVYML